MLQYTICFIRKGSKWLMLNRKSKPNMGLWNGVGGKIDPGETAEQSIVREVWEETGIRIAAPRFAGIVTWEAGVQLGGMYVFLVELERFVDSGPPDAVTDTDEGILAWLEQSWILDPNNRGVVSNIHYYLPRMLQDPDCYQHHCTYNDEGTLTRYEATPLQTPTELAMIRQ